MDVGVQNSHKASNVGPVAKLPRAHPTHKKGSNRMATPAELDDDYTVMQYRVSIQLTDFI